MVEGYEEFRLRIIEQRRLHTKMIQDDQKPAPDSEFIRIYKSLGNPL